MLEANERMNGKYHPDTLAPTVNLAATCAMTACRALPGTYHPSLDLPLSARVGSRTRNCDSRFWPPTQVRLI